MKNVALFRYDSVKCYSYTQNGEIDILTSSFSFSSISAFFAQCAPTFELEYILRVLIGGVLGLCIGYERSRRQKDAGMGTHFIVACASALLTCISLWFKKDAGDMGDGARIAAQIVSGVGFLGAGMIFFRRESMRGLTSAASIWATAAIGMCAATGMYILAVCTTIAIILLQFLVHTKLLKREIPHTLLIKFEYSKAVEEKLRSFFDFREFHRFVINANHNSEAAAGSNSILVEAVIHPVKHYNVEALAEFISQTPEVQSIERLEDL